MHGCVCVSAPYAWFGCVTVSIEYEKISVSFQTICIKIIQIRKFLMRRRKYVNARRLYFFSVLRVVFRPIYLFTNAAMCVMFSVISIFFRTFTLLNVMSPYILILTYGNYRK